MTQGSSPKRSSLVNLARKAPVGSRARVLSLTAVDVKLEGRLRDLGMHTGEEIEFLGRAPLGEPYFIVIRDTTVALRESEASVIEVEAL